jgi:hypothetical protein
MIQNPRGFLFQLCPWKLENEQHTKHVEEFMVFDVFFDFACKEEITKGCDFNLVPHFRGISTKC